MLTFIFLKLKLGDDLAVLLLSSKTYMNDCLLECKPRRDKFHNTRVLRIVFNCFFNTLAQIIWLLFAQYLELKIESSLNILSFFFTLKSTMYFSVSVKILVLGRSVFYRGVLLSFFLFFHMLSLCNFLLWVNRKGTYITYNSKLI